MNDRFKFRAYIDGHGMTNNFSLIDIFRGKIVKAGDGFHLDPETLEYFPGVHLMQSTGRKDSEGRLIYEGDILEIGIYSDTPPTYHEVVWGNDYPAFDIEPRIHDDCNSLHGSLIDFSASVKVIGNIYENKELLSE